MPTPVTPLELPERPEPPAAARPAAPPAERGVAALALVLAVGCSAGGLLAAFVTAVMIGTTGVEDFDISFAMGLGLTVTSAAAVLGGGAGVWWSGRTLLGARLLGRAFAAILVAAAALPMWWAVGSS